MKTTENRFLVARTKGGEQGNGSMEYIDYQVIYAETKKEAENEYNYLNQCSYSYGFGLAGVINDIEVVYDRKVTYEQVRMLKNHTRAEVWIVYRNEELFRVFDSEYDALKLCDNIVDRYKYDYKPIGLLGKNFEHNTNFGEGYVSHFFHTGQGIVNICSRVRQFVG